MSNQAAHKAALQWYLDHGVDEALGDEPVDRLAPVEAAVVEPAAVAVQPESFASAPAPVLSPSPSIPEKALLGSAQARVEAVKLAQAAQNLEELRQAIADFDGLPLKKTATNLVFSDGNPKAPIMLVGEAPGADEDRQGKPFVGVSGQLLDKILRYIDVNRHEEDPAKAIYISNILNWRPPGNRTPAPGEIEVSLPFIERHIQLVQPKLLIFCGGVSAKSLLGRTEGISRLRKSWHDYLPQVPELREGAQPIPAIATYHPAYLLRTPAQKRAVWADMLTLLQKRRDLGV